jgi:hypothetical protein
MHYLLPVLVLATVLTIAISLVILGWTSSNRPTALRIGVFSLGCLLLLGVSTAPYLLYPVFEQARARANTVACATNVSNLHRALMLYRADQGGLPGEEWADHIETYSSPENFRCPEVDEDYAFSMNAAFSMYKSELDADIVGGDRIDPKQVLLFDGIGGKNSMGSMRDARYRHLDDTAVFLLADGNTKVLNRKEAELLAWTDPQSLPSIELIVTDMADHDAGITVAMELMHLNIHYATITDYGLSRYYLNEPLSPDESAQLRASLSRFEVTIFGNTMRVRSNATK